MKRLPTHGLRRLAVWLAVWLAISVSGMFGAALPASAQTPEVLDLLSIYQTDVRALAMGNAFGPIARGENALFYNPAGLAQYAFDTKLEVAVTAAGAEGDFFTDTLELVGTTGTPTAVTNYLTKYLGTSQRYSYQLGGNIVANMGAFNSGVGGGLLEKTRYRFTFTDLGPVGFDVNDTLTLEKEELEMSVASVAFRLIEGQMLVGATLKNFNYTVSTAVDTFGNVAATGNIELAGIAIPYDGTGFDLGIIWRMETLSFLRAQWSWVAYNVGGITLDSTGAPSLFIPATYNLGLAINPELPWSPVHLLISVELEDALGSIIIRDAGLIDHDRSVKQRTHYGIELGFWETSTGNHLISLRGGSHRGQATWGAEINVFSGLRIVYASYGDDFGHENLSDIATFDTIHLAAGFAF